MLYASLHFHLHPNLPSFTYSRVQFISAQIQKIASTTARFPFYKIIQDRKIELHSGRRTKRKPCVLKASLKPWTPHFQGDNLSSISSSMLAITKQAALNTHIHTAEQTHTGQFSSLLTNSDKTTNYPQWTNWSLFFKRPPFSVLTEATPGQIRLPFPGFQL